MCIEKSLCIGLAPSGMFSHAGEYILKCQSRISNVAHISVSRIFNIRALSNGTRRHLSEMIKLFLRSYLLSWFVVLI
jgi:hypothetical protein